MNLESLDFSFLKAPLFIAWHMTNKCNLECIHCLWEAGPKNSWKDELSEEEAISLCEEIIKLNVPYVAISGGEPLLHPAFFKVCKILRENKIDVKIETNGLFIDDVIAKDLAELNLRSVQISLDGASQETFSLLRPGVVYQKVIESIKELVNKGVNTEIVYVPAKFSLHEVEKLIDLSVELGVSAFYTGKTMYIGRAVKYWDIISLSEIEYENFYSLLEKKAKEYEGKLHIFYYPYDVIEELKYRVNYPAASLLVMANGKVKLIGSLPFVCGDIRKHTLKEVWEQYKYAWKLPEVKKYVDNLLCEPKLLAEANKFIDLRIGSDIKV